jgi:hypothetical protein
VAQLREQRIYSRTVAVTKPAGVRLSLGFWTRPADVDEIASAVARLAEAAPVRLDKCRDAADRVELVEPEDCGGQLLHPLVREHEPGVAAELLEHPLARHLARVT